MKKLIATLALSLFAFAACGTPTNYEDAADPNFKEMYKPYSQTNLEESLEKGPTILFFHAQWCGSCVALANDFKDSISELPENFTILEVNYDDDAMTEKWEVRSQHTLVLLNQEGSELHRWSGGGIETVKQEIEDYK